ncbi:hypothetical protein GCM10022224_066620 [Nonomuraea antimicrobica]|uniref:Uncharacterized protein n=1 Tax=Nonomuraea antimicrobica TaxID=561173 RepID=A0ABP7CJX5_9ACTN
MPYVVGGRAREGLGAVAALKDERLAAGHRGQLLLELVALAGEDQRGQAAEFGDNLVELAAVWPVRLLRRGEGSPGIEIH